MITYTYTYFFLGVAGQPCKFTVETSGAAVDTLGFAVEGPHQAEIKCRDLGNGKCEVIYYPTKPGDYTVHVTCNGKDIPDSPFTVPITPGGDASKCYAEGPGLEPEGVVASKTCYFCCSCIFVLRSSEGNLQNNRTQIIKQSQTRDIGPAKCATTRVNRHVQLIIYVNVYVYAKFSSYRITCLYFCLNDQWLNVGSAVNA